MTRGVLVGSSELHLQPASTSAAAVAQTGASIDSLRLCFQFLSCLTASVVSATLSVPPCNVQITRFVNCVSTCNLIKSNLNSMKATMNCPDCR